MSNVENEDMPEGWRSNPDMKVALDGQHIRIESATNQVGETIYIIAPKQSNGEFSKLCILNNEILEAMLDRKNAKFSDCDDGKK